MFSTNPGSDRKAAGYNAAGKRAGPHGGNNIGDHVKNGAVGGIMPLKCDDTGGIGVGSDIRSSTDVCRVGDGDGEHRRFLFSVATIASFITLNKTQLHNYKYTFFVLDNCFFFFVKDSLAFTLNTLNFIVITVIVVGQ